MGEKVATAPSPASAGKQLDQEPIQGHIRGGERAAPTGDETTGTKEPLFQAGQNPIDVEQLDAAKVEGMTMQELEAAMGLQVEDRSLAAPAAGGTAQTAHQIKDAIQAGTAVDASTVKPGDAAAPATDGKTAQQPKAVAPGAQATDQGTGTEGVAATTEEPEGTHVEARDGKGKIPYTVLQTTRRRVAELTRENAELKARSSQTQQQVQEAVAAAGGTAEAQSSAEAATEAAESGLLTDEQLAALSDEFPEKLVNILRGVNNAARAAVEAANEVKQTHEQEVEQQVRDRAQSVQDFIDSDPVLAGWQMNDDPTQWQAAVALDNVLRGQPKWDGKPFQDRFTEVKRMLHAEAAPASTTTTTQGQQPSLQARADAALAQRQAASATQGRAITHSDIPGGTPPAQSEQDAVGTMTTMDLEKKMQGMTNTQLEAFLARVA